MIRFARIERAVWLLIPVITLTGCSGYRSGEWPRLNYDDPGAPEIAAAHHETETAENVPDAAAGTELALGSAPIQSLSMRLRDLQDTFSALNTVLTESAAALETADPADRRPWFTLQLNLSRLSRLDSDVSALQREADVAGTAPEGSPLSNLKRDIDALRASVRESFAHFQEISRLRET